LSDLAVTPMPAAATVLRRAFLVVLSAFAAAGLPACSKAPGWLSTEYEPVPGQPGKDVIWVPTSQALVEKMLDMAEVTPKDYVMDLGSGDGRTVIAAAERGATARGIEFNPDMVALARDSAMREGVADRASFAKADLFGADLSRASVITMFLLPDINLKLRPKLLALKPGTRVVSNTFTMGDWEADRTESVAHQNCAGGWCSAHLWIVPAKVAGSYSLPQGKLVLRQKFQKLSGTLESEGKSVPVDGTVRGSAITFSAGGTTYRGRLKGKELVLG